jgi:uncharacterized protein (TIGR02145 family)
MKTKMRILVSSLFLGLFLIAMYGCKKDSSDTTPPTPVVTITDFDGNVYPTITIGTQVWMAANLKTTHYRNGTSIPQVSDSTEWSGLTTPASCYLDNNADKLITYGRLYNWLAVTDSNNIAPTGWHVPTDAEWSILETFLGTGPGGKMKTTGTSLWLGPNAGASNSSGFSGLPGGDRSYNGLYHYEGMYGCFWSTTESSAANAWEHVITYTSANVTRMEYSKNLGLSVRCVKD